MKINKILLIRSSHYSNKGTVVKSNSFIDLIFNANYAELGLPLLAAATPSHIKVEMVDDCLDKTPEKTEAEVVGISAMAIHFSRVRDLAEKFRKQGKIVLLGGFLPSLYPELVEDIADSICIGEGDRLWPIMLDDIEKGVLKKRYVSDNTAALKGLPVPRYDLIKRNRVTVYPVMASRGCMHSCEYCSVISFFKKTYRLRPIDEVIRDIKAHGSRLMYFVDDNLTDSTAYAKELFKAMRGLRVRWGLQTTPSVGEDRELLDLAYKAGCRTMAIGFESINQKNLDHVSKDWARAQHYKRLINAIKSAGISPHALIMFGLPDDTKKVFEASVDFLIEAGVSAADFFILTPYLATPLGKKYLEQGLIVDKDINHYREPYVVFRHKKMSGDEIRAGYWNAFKRFYSLKSIARRVVFSKAPNKLFAIYTNLYYKRKILKKIVPTHNQRGDYQFQY